MKSYWSVKSYDPDAGMPIKYRIIFSTDIAVGGNIFESYYRGNVFQLLKNDLSNTWVNSCPHINIGSEQSILLSIISIEFHVY